MAGLLERDGELEQLDAALATAARGEGSLLVVEGPAGIGKSLLLEQAQRLAPDRGMLPLTARGGQLEREFSFGVMRQLFERQLLESTEERRAALLSGPAALSLPAVGILGGAEPAPADASFAVCHGLYWLVANLALDAPLMLTVDDVHWADAPSLRALAYLAARLEGAPVLLVVAARTGEYGPAARLLGELLGQPAATLRPAPLSTVGVEALIASRLGAATTPALGTAAERATGGNPFLVEELLRALSAHGRGASVVRSEEIERLGPRTVARSLLLRLGQLPPAAAGLARAVAVLAGHAELRHAAALANVDEDEAARAADALAAAEILSVQQPLAFVHPMVRTAVYDDIPPAERASLHALAATLLRDDGVTPGELAPHLLATEPAGDAATVALLRAAAARALGHGAPDLAQRYLRRALREPPEPAVLPQVLGELGDSEWLSGENQLAAVDHLTEALARTSDPVTRCDRALALHRALFAAGQVTESCALLEHELERLRGQVDPEVELRVEAELSSTALLHPSTVDGANARLARFVRLEGATPAELLQLANVACWKWAAGTAEETVAFGERALADARIARIQAADAADSIPIYEALWALCHTDALDLAWALLDDTLADARARGSVFGVTTSCALRALIALNRGDAAAAEMEARTGIALPGLSDFVRPPLFGQLTLALVARDELAEAETAIEQSGCGPDLPEFVCLNPVFYARGMLRLAQGRWEDALADFAELGERSRRVRLHYPGDPWRLGAAEALIRLERPGEAVAMADEQLELARRWGTRSAIGIALHGRALAYGGGPDALAEATEVLASSHARLHHARSLVDLGSALRRSNRRGEARDVLRQGLELARRCGAPALSRRAHDELLVAGARPRRLMFSGPEGLTASERRVAEMAAEKLSNREIAQALFVTIKTVENQLGRAYLKLGIASRGELPQALGLAVAGDPEALTPEPAPSVR